LRWISKVGRVNRVGRVSEISEARLEGRKEDKSLTEWLFSLNEKSQM